MKHMITLAFAGFALAISCCTSQVQAAEPGFCRRYAAEAVEQFGRAMSSPVCASRVGGLRWHGNYERHFGWCLSVPPFEVQHEWDARSRLLHHCLG
jgi:hypothetical protein